MTTAAVVRHVAKEPHPFDLKIMMLKSFGMVSPLTVWKLPGWPDGMSVILWIKKM